MNHTFNPPVTITSAATGLVTVSPQDVAQPPPPPPPVTPPAGNRDAAILATVRKLRGEGARGSVLASMFIQYAGAGSRLEPVLKREIPNYAQWLDGKSFGAPHNDNILIPSAEWDRMQELLRALPR